MPVIHSGTWAWRSGFGPAATPSPNNCGVPVNCTSWFYEGSPDFHWKMGFNGFNLSPKHGTLTFPFQNNALYLDGVLTDPQNLPPGFHVADAFSLTGVQSAGPPAGFATLRFEFSILGIDVTVTDWTDFPFPYASSGMNILNLISIGGWPMVLTGDIPDDSGGHFFWVDTLLPGNGAIYFTGAYTIEIYWWRLPEVSACGERQTGRLQYSGDAPTLPSGQIWERYDPLDPDAAPTPEVTLIQPNAGRTAGGTAVTIIGSGFGDDATVEFDGVPATDVVVVSEREIQCVTPAHVAATVNVVVTNVDGGHN